MTSASTHKGLFRAALLIGVVTIGSKLLGAVRDWQIITLFGTQLLTDAYYTGFQLPSFALILLGGVGGPFHTATVSVLTPLLDDGKPSPTARRVLSSLGGITLILGSLLALLVYWQAEPICRLMLNAQASPAFVRQAADQLRLMTPIIAIGPLVGIACGLQNLANQFFWPSFAPAALSLVLIGALACFKADAYLLAVATVVGAFAQLAVQLPDVLRAGWLTGPKAGSASAALTQMGRMIGPAIVGTTAGQCNVYVDIYFTSLLPQGGWTAVVQANRLIQLPIGVLQSALLVPVFPRFTQQVAQQDWQGLRDTFRLGISSLWVVSLPILAVIMLHGRWLIALLFERGAFTAQSTQLVYDALLGLSLSLVVYFARDTLTRVFYAFQNTRTPLVVGLAAIIINVLADALLVGPLGVKGITLATTLVTVFNGVCLAVLLQRMHLPGLGWSAMACDLGWISLQTTLAAILGWTTMVGLDGILPVWQAQWVSLLAQLLCQAVLLFGLPVPAAKQLLSRFIKQKP
jgi:putative peptidoglycan lipid II flippase